MARGIDDGRAQATEDAGKGEQRASSGQRDPEDGVGFFCPSGARPQTQMMFSYIDNHRDRFGVEPVCKQLPIAPSTYYDHKARQRDPEERSERARREERLMPEIQRVWAENFRLYGTRKVWLQLKRDGVDVARCTVARLMKTLGIEGIRRGRRRVTTIPGKDVDRPRDAVNRDFTVARPNELWVADLTYVAT